MGCENVTGIELARRTKAQSQTRVIPPAGVRSPDELAFLRAFVPASFLDLLVEGLNGVFATLSSTHQASHRPTDRDEVWRFVLMILDLVFGSSAEHHNTMRYVRSRKREKLLDGISAARVGEPCHL